MKLFCFAIYTEVFVLGDPNMNLDADSNKLGGLLGGRWRALLSQILHCEWTFPYHA